MSQSTTSEPIFAAMNDTYPTHNVGCNRASRSYRMRIVLTLECEAVQLLCQYSTRQSS